MRERRYSVGLAQLEPSDFGCKKAIHSCARQCEDSVGRIYAETHAQAHMNITQGSTFVPKSILAGNSFTRSTVMSAVCNQHRQDALDVLPSPRSSNRQVATSTASNHTRKHTSTNTYARPASTGFRSLGFVSTTCKQCQLTSVAKIITRFLANSSPILHSRVEGRRQSAALK